MAVPSGLECLRCRRRYPIVPMPAGCPSCATEGTPSNVAPVYGRMTPLRPGKADGAGVARYLTQLPVGRDRLVTMGEGDTPLLATQALGPQLGLRRLLIKDERQNPTGSWRDRFAALAVSQLEDSSVTMGTAGDEAQCVALASYASRAGLRSVSLVDPAVSERTRDAIEAVGGRIVAVTDPEGRWPLLADAERTLGWRVVSNRATPPIGSDPMAVEGYRTIAYEIAEQLRFSAPDLVVAPAGSATASRASGGASANWSRGACLTGSRAWSPSSSAAPWRARSRVARTGSPRPAMSSRRRGRWPVSPGRCRRCTRSSSPKGSWCAFRRRARAGPHADGRARGDVDRPGLRRPDRRSREARPARRRPRPRPSSSRSSPSTASTTSRPLPPGRSRPSTVASTTSCGCWRSG